MNADRAMLFSAVCTLHAVEDTTLPATHGHLGHAAFLALIDSVQPALAQALHDTPGRKPFTVSSLRGLPRPRDGRCRLLAGAGCWLRLTLLGQELFTAFMERLLTGPHATIRLGRARFQVSQVLTTPGSHPWAGYATAGELRAGAGTGHRIRLVFASPTAFSVGRTDDGKKRRMVVFPQPELVWASLRGSWNAFTDDEIPIEFERWVERNVVVREVRSWRTAMHRFRNGVQVGGRGDIIFEALDDDSVNLHTLNALADFSFYAGIGTKTTMGMGQTRRLT